MAAVDIPLDLGTAFTSWRFDPISDLVAVAAVCACLYLIGKGRRRGAAIERSRLANLVVGLALWLIADNSFVGVYSDTLFWVRALQVVLLLFAVPFALASGTPLTLLRNALAAEGQRRFDAVLASRLARILTFPATSSVVMLATPWLLYITPWYSAVLNNSAVDTATRLFLVVAGFGYFYARLQADPVPHRYSQLVSLVITVVEVIGDGALGVVVWLGPQIAAAHYVGLHRTWGPSPVTDQIIGAGVLWILGDVIGLPFLFALMRAFTADERVKGVAVDAELDAAGPVAAPWWEGDRKDEKNNGESSAEQTADSFGVPEGETPVGDRIGYWLGAVGVAALLVTFGIGLASGTWPPEWEFVAELGVLGAAILTIAVSGFAVRGGNARSGSPDTSLMVRERSAALVRPTAKTIGVAVGVVLVIVAVVGLHAVS